MPDTRRSKDSVLILGGTTEARQLGEQLVLNFPHCQFTMSLAGRTRTPLRQPIPTRIGGFGGITGLARWLIDHCINMLIIATHPFAAHMPMNAIAAAQQAGIPVVRLLRPAWRPSLGDNWHSCKTLDYAAQQLGTPTQRVFLPIGRQSLTAFATAPQHIYIVRSIEPLDETLLLPHVHSVRARGPFSQQEEEALMAQWHITRMVCKNSGGNAMATKLHAARALGIPILMVERPTLAASIPTFDDINALVEAFPLHLQSAH